MRGKRPRALTAESTRGAGDDHPSAGEVEAFKHLIGSRRIPYWRMEGGLSDFRQRRTVRGGEVSHFGASAKLVAVLRPVLVRSGPDAFGHRRHAGNGVRRRADPGRAGGPFEYSLAFPW